VSFLWNLLHFFILNKNETRTQMKSILYFTILTTHFIFCCGMTYAQLSATLNFDTQTQLDNYFAANPGLTTLLDLGLANGTGSLDPIMNTSALSNITDIGTLIISDWSTNMDLSGLSNLTSLDTLLTANVEQFDFVTNVTNLELLIINSWFGELSLNFNGFDNLQTAGSIYLNLSNPTSIIVNAFPSLHTLDHLAFSPYGSSNEMAHIGTFDGLNAVTSMQSLYIGENEPTTFSLLNICNAVTQLNDFLTYIYFPNGAPAVNSTICQNLISADNMRISGDFPFDDFSVQTINTLIIDGNGAPTLTALPNATTVLDLYIFTYSPIQVDLPLLATVQNLAVEGAPWWPAVDVNLNIPQIANIPGNFTFSGTLQSSLDFLENVVSIGGEVTIENNPNLSDCSVQAICHKLNIAPNDVTISGNTGACAELADVAAACFVPTITGNIYYDLNCNQVYDTDDVGVAYPLIADDTGTFIGSSNGNGGYTIVAPPNGILTFAPIAPAGTDEATPVFIDTDALTANTNIDFAICPDGSFHDVEVNSMIGTWVRYGFNTQYYFTIKNNSFHTETVQLTVDLSLFSNYTNWNITLPHSIVGQSIVFDPITLGPFEEVAAYVIGTLSTWTPLGTPANMSATVNILNTDIDLSNNSSQVNAVVVGSYDPNDILVNTPLIDVEQADANGDWLTYRIRFQNTGNFPAEFVNVVSEQNELVDMSTIQMIDASHANSWSFDGREVTWFFDNIQLPDSTTDLEGSQGYVIYKVRTMEGLGVGDVLDVNAAIYFDFNEPVITNTAMTEYYLCPEPLVLATNDTAICEYDIASLSASNGYDTYTWSFNDQTLSTQQTLNYAAIAPGLYTITCEALATPDVCQSSASINMEVIAVPEIPIITQDGNTLLASGAGTFVWSLDGVELNNTSNTIEITQTGNYSVSIDGDCPSETAIGNYTHIGMDNLHQVEILMYPNPANDVIYLQNIPQQALIQILDLTGRVCMEARSQSAQEWISIDELSAGTYVMQVVYSNGLKRQSFVKG
jgi:hypothetical protein